MTTVTVKCTNAECDEEREIDASNEPPAQKLPKCPECSSGMIPEHLMDMKEYILATFEVED